MKKPHSLLIRIENPIPGKEPLTSLRAAQRMIAHGWAVWTILNIAIRLREKPEVLAERNIAVEMERNRQYWAGIAQEKACGEVVGIIATSITPAGNYPWSNHLGTVGREIRMVARP